MTHPLILRPEAEEDLLDAYRWYEERVPGLGLRFLESVERTLGQIERSSQLYAAVCSSCPYSDLPVRHLLFA